MSNGLEIITTHRVHRAVSLPVTIAGTFTLNGASQPTAWDALFKSVTRHVSNANTLPVFRLRFNPGIKAPFLLVFSCKAPTGVDNDALTAQQVDVTLNPVSAREDVIEVDVQVIDSGVAVDTAGVVVTVYGMAKKS